MLENLERCLGLHEHLEQGYYVDRYESRLYSQDRLVMVGWGPTLYQSLVDLDLQCIGFNTHLIRGLPDLESRNISHRYIRTT